MARILKYLGTIITIGGGDLPAASAAPWWSGGDGVGSALETGHSIPTYYADELGLYVMVDNWGAVPSLEVLLERNPLADGTGPWGRVEMLGALQALGPDLTVTSGKLLVAASMGVTNRAYLRLPLDGAQRFRVGVRAGGVGAVTNFMGSVAAEIIARQQYA